MQEEKGALARVAVALALVAPAVWAPHAGASASVTPFQQDFGKVAPGSSASRIFTLTAICDDDPALLGYTCDDPINGDPPLPVSISVSGGFSQTNNCPAELPRSAPANSVSCSITVTFSPTSAGAVQGLLSTGPAAESPVAALAGAGQAARAVAPPKKKCKKKRRGEAAASKKRCGKK